MKTEASTRQDTYKSSCDTFNSVAIGTNEKLESINETLQDILKEKQEAKDDAEFKKLLVRGVQALESIAQSLKGKENCQLNNPVENFSHVL